MTASPSWTACCTRNNLATHCRFRHQHSFFRNGLEGKPFECVQRARAGEAQVVTCPELIEELAEKLDSRLHFSADQVAETIADYLGFLQVIRIPKVLMAVPRDPEDNMVLECAIEGEAQYIVSGDKHLLELKEFRGIRIIRTGDFLNLLPA